MNSFFAFVGTLKLENLVKDGETLRRKIALKKYFTPETLKRLSIAKVDLSFVNKVSSQHTNLSESNYIILPIFMNLFFSVV